MPGRERERYSDRERGREGERGRGRERARERKMKCVCVCVCFDVVPSVLVRQARVATDWHKGWLLGVKQTVPLVCKAWRERDRERDSITERQRGREQARQEREGATR